MDAKRATRDLEAAIMVVMFGFEVSLASTESRRAWRVEILIFGGNKVLSSKNFVPAGVHRIQGASHRCCRRSSHHILLLLLLLCALSNK